MVNTKDNPMITGSILHHKIIEELGEVPRQTAGGLAKSPTSVAPRVVATLSERTPSERILDESSTTLRVDRPVGSRRPTLFVGTWRSEL